MGTTLPRLDDRLRNDPDDDADDACDTDPYLHADYNWTGWPGDSRWRPAAAILGAVVAVGAIATAVIINSGDSASTKATLGPAPQPVTSAPATTKASAPRSPSRVTPLPPETVTTVTTPSAAPSTPAAQIPTVAPPLAAAPPTAALNPRTVVYSVGGTKQLLDLVNVVYTDARGVPQSEFNVSLPWSKMVVLNPGVQTESVVATSFYGQLSCSVFNAAGQRIMASASPSNIATCSR